MKEQSYISKPIDTLFIRTETKSVYEVVRRIEKKIFITTPDFQRNLVWSEDEKSKLIESALIRIPLPVIYMAENESGDVVVVDGKQRLSTFYSYLANKFKLTGITKNPLLNGKYFNELEITLQNRIEDTQLIIYTLDAKINEDVRLDIFERVNSGRAISRQEMRNCLYTGPATKLTEAMCENKNFLQILDNHFQKNLLKNKTNATEPMLDRLYANRFISFSCISLKEYNSDSMMDVYLAMGLKFINKEPDSRNDIMRKFSLSMGNCLYVFGEDSFRKITRNRKGPVNISLFDVISVIFSRIKKNDVIKHKDELYEIFIELLDDKKFHKAISNATNTMQSIHDKFEIANKAYMKFIN
jgi:uncharacterized protein with ParB-like and HNH nuclease domain